MNNPKAGLRMGFPHRDINRRTGSPLPLSLRGRQAVAISWYCVKICTMYQEIATGFALAMTVRGRPVPLRPGAFGGTARWPFPTGRSHLHETEGGGRKPTALR